MAQVIKFYQTEGRSIIYTTVSRGVQPILDNWDGTTETRVKDGYLFITERAFNYVPELLDAEATPYELVQVSKEQEAQVKTILDQIADHKGETLEGDEDADETRVNTTLCLELDDENYIEVSVNATGKITGDGGDYFNPPSYETEWGEIELDDLKVWIGEDEVEFNDLQEQVILDAIEGLIELQ